MNNFFSTLIFVYFRQFQEISRESSSRLACDDEQSKMSCFCCERAGDCVFKDKFGKIQSRTYITDDNCLLQMRNNEFKCRNLYSLTTPYCLKNDFETGDKKDTKEFPPEYVEEKEKKSNVLINIRELLANYQESSGISRSEYSFASLVSAMGRVTGQSLLAIFYVIINIAPVAEVI